MAIEAGNVFGEENVCTLLLERGTELEEDIWHKLLILALNYDLVSYPRLAHKAGINLHNCREETRISLHKAVCCHAVKILKFFLETFAPEKLAGMIKESDFQGLNAREYAKLTENTEIIAIVDKMFSGEIPNDKSSMDKNPIVDS